MFNLCSSIDIPKSTAMRWLAIIAAAKVIWLVVFIALRSPSWTEHSSVGIALQPNESLGYYHPLESLIEEGHYQGMCHLPGLLPFYLPLRIVLPETAALQAMIVLQVLFDIAATWALGILAARIFHSLRAMHITYALACISTFTAVRNNYLLSDSLCISLTILSIFKFSTYLIRRNSKDLLLAAIGVCIAIFLRPAMLAVLPGLAFFLVVSEGVNVRSFRSISLLVLPTVLALTAWTARNKITYDRTVILLAPLGECQPQITPDFAAIRSWIIASGGDYQPWAVGGESHWFFDSPGELPMPFDNSDYTDDYDESALISLKEDYHKLHSGTLSFDDSLSLEKSIISRGNSICASYIAAHPFRYYVFNRIKFAGMILFPNRIDDLPFPAFNEMNLFQKTIKVFSYLCIPMLSVLSILACVFWFIHKKWSYLLWMCLPMGLVFIHSAIGFVEQRYLASSYPFFLMLAGGFLTWLFGAIRQRLGAVSKPLS